MSDVPDEVNPFGDNLKRLLGMHALPARHFARIVNISAQTLSGLVGGRAPSMSSAQTVAHFFEVPLGDLIDKGFDQLLGYGADIERFHRVEAKIPDDAKAREWHV